MANAYVPAESSARFYVPNTLASDFTKFLQNDIPGAVGDFTLIPNWYEQNDVSVIRGEIYPDSTKSRYSNTDNNLNFRADINSGIKKGDMIVGDDGTIYLLDWDVPPEPNNRMSRALRCNCRLTFNRYFAEEVDELGMLVNEGGMRSVADEIPCNAYRHDGRLEFSTNSSMPGLMPNAVTLLSVQLNPHTERIQADDEFVWGKETYVIADVNYAGVSINGAYGVIQLQAKKKAGGML